MTGELDLADIARLAAQFEAAWAELPEESGDGGAAFEAAAKSLVGEVAGREGATVGLAGDGCVLRLAGIDAASEEGYAALILAWLAAAHEALDAGGWS